MSFINVFDGRVEFIYIKRNDVIQNNDIELKPIMLSLKINQMRYDAKSFVNNQYERNRNHLKVSYLHLEQGTHIQFTRFQWQCVIVMQPNSIQLKAIFLYRPEKDYF